MDCNEIIVTHKLLDCNETIVTHKLLDCNEMIVTHKLLDGNEIIVTLGHWFRSYLSGRLQQVQYNGQTSMPKVIRCGVPQGSILGPLCRLFRMKTQ